MDMAFRPEKIDISKEEKWLEDLEKGQWPTTNIYEKMCPGGLRGKPRHDDRLDALVYSQSYYRPFIKKVIFNDPDTIVYWTDGTKTVVKVGFGEIFDEEKGLAMAISKKFFGNKGNYYNQFRKWLPEKKDDGVEGTVWADGEIAGCIDKDGKFFISPLLEQAAKEKEDEKIHNCSLGCPFCKEHINKDVKITYFCALCKKDIDINASVVKYKECPIYNNDNKKTQIVDNEIVRCDSNCTKCGTVNKAGDLHIYHCRAVDLDVSIHADLSLDHKQDCGIYKKYIGKKTIEECEPDSNISGHD